MTDRARAGVRLPRRLLNLPGYPLADIPDIKARLAAEGRSVIDLGVGDPGLPAPAVAIEALRDAAGDPAMHGYAFQRGHLPYRRAVASWLEDRFGRPMDAEREVLPLIGSKEGIALLAFALLDPGDVALVPDPCYAAYVGGSLFAGARVCRHRLRSQDGFLVPPEAIRDVEGPLKLVYLNYPNNPTGAVAERAYLEDVVAACRDRGAVLAYDNAYSEIAFDGFRPPGLLEIPGATDVGIEFHSFSKTFNMTGWRLGWACGGSSLVGALARVKTFFDTGVFLAVQAAGAAVLERGREAIEANVEVLRSRRDTAVSAFRAAGLDVCPPRATLYLWFPVPTAEDSASYCRRLLEETGVILLPGSAMGEGGEGWLRASLSVEPALYEEVARRIAEAG
ncbi:MAG: aminotransferase class I/II-fold pyridoxal phosphate-dependent enzyme [Gemmatimonadota bacterium]